MSKVEDATDLALGVVDDWVATATRVDQRLYPTGFQEEELQDWEMTLGIPQSSDQQDKNLINNPSFEMSGPITVVHENRALNPFCRPGGSTMGVSNNPSVWSIAHNVLVTRLGGTGNIIRRVPGSSSSVSQLASITNVAGLSNQVPSYRLQITVVSSIDGRARLLATDPYVDVPANVPKVIHTTVPDNTPSYFQFTTPGGGVVPTGAWVAYSYVTTDADGVVFDGSQSPIPSLDVKWLGVPNKSASQLTLTRPLGFTKGQQSSDWSSDGRYSLYLSDINADFVETVRNRFVNPSFEGPSIPDGATFSTEWSMVGARSLYIAPSWTYPSTTTFPGTNTYPMDPS
jgi:hypothetical protein